ncbi:MAG: NADH:ubiquinone reductase (Na(+)-transporting) subunit C, partial [Bacteroidota bacterium]|nr:NADH:ubiquinone reductase (Na(+)-transporting) subunit C [Bacteroidota bacterium]
DIDLGKEIKKDADAQLLPLFISEVDGAIRYIIPLRGKGLWGPIWGFIALEDDLNKVYGAVFDHEKETPGLGAEINTPMFQKPFTGKTIFEEEEFIPIQVIKGGAKEGDMHAVDGISGGTITSDGVSEMLYERLNMYLPYLNKIKEAIEVERAIAQIDSLAIINDSIIE